MNNITENIKTKHKWKFLMTIVIIAYKNCNPRPQCFEIVWNWIAVIL